MEKTTVLARLRLTVRFNEAAREWCAVHPRAWYARDEGTVFLSEYGGTWEGAFMEIVQPEVQRYFANLGLPRDKLPFVRVGEKYRGSWVLDAVVAIAATIGTTYTI